MSHQRYASHDPVKEPHSVSIKVLRQGGRGRLSRPSLVTQYPLDVPLAAAGAQAAAAVAAASLAYGPSTADTNASPFFLSPMLNLPVSFGSAYVGETFSCTLCANNDAAAGAGKHIRDVRIEAEMKTPGLGPAHKLDLGPAGGSSGGGSGGGATGVDVDAGGTLQRVVAFDLKEEGNHVLAVTVSYYEATETSGRTRTFRKLYQFMCKASLIVRTKVAARGRGRWVLEAQLENCSDEAVQLDRVGMELDDGFRYEDCNWEVRGGGGGKPVLQPGEVEQVCFVVVAEGGGEDEAASGRVTFGVLGIGWRGEMGNRGFLSTGKLGARAAAAR